MDMENIANIRTGNAAPVIVDPQVSNKEDPEQKQAQKTPKVDSVEISSEATTANAVQNTPDVTKDQKSGHHSGELPHQSQEENSDITTENSVKQNLDDRETQNNERASSLSEELENLRESTADHLNSLRKTNFKVVNGNVSVTVQNGDKEIEIPPEEVIATKNNLKQRLQAFVDASNVDINV